METLNNFIEHLTKLIDECLNKELGLLKLSMMEFIEYL